MKNVKNTTEKTLEFLEEIVQENKLLRENTWIFSSRIFLVKKIIDETNKYEIQYLTTRFNYYNRVKTLQEMFMNKED